MDSSSNGFNATMNGSGASYAPRPRPSAAESIPTAGSIVVPANPAFDNLQSWTDSVWVNISSSSASGCLVACRDYDSMHGLVEEYKNGVLDAAMASASGGWLFQPSNFQVSPRR